MPDSAPKRFARGRVARLATAGPQGRPHLVPIVFAVDPDADPAVIYSAVDAKPKRTTALRRLANVRAEPRVSLLVDHYDDADWDALWWVRADGVAEVLAPDDPRARHGVDLLVARYPQYRERRPGGPVLAITVTRWVSWSATAMSEAT